MGKMLPLRMFLISALVSLGGSFHFGFQLCVTNPAQQALMTFVNDSHALHYGWSHEENAAKVIILKTTFEKKNNLFLNLCYTLVRNKER